LPTNLTKFRRLKRATEFDQLISEQSGIEGGPGERMRKRLVFHFK